MKLVKIEKNGNSTRIFVDNEEIKNVKSYSIEHEALKTPLLKINMEIPFSGNYIINNIEAHLKEELQ